MGNSGVSALLALIGVMLLWPSVLTKSVSSKLQPADSVSPPAGQGEEHPHVVKRSTQNCDKTFDSYCLNRGQCMLLVDIDQHFCKCERGFYGPRCANPELVFKPIGEEHIILIIFCVTLLIIGLAGALYFFCKWYKKNRFPHRQRQQGYKGVQSTQCVTPTHTPMASRGKSQPGFSPLF
ncbi:proepiregulin isoform X1 [Echeneis naucrates]|uniref:EGF-like domain-containing protein n=1 Tax=Echeneis naucrates TaxID=173247 RepID=A0A665WHK4_ECHNA|nr:proepiregulin isoform X1 [Echeneis naucrates]